MPGTLRAQALPGPTAVRASPGQCPHRVRAVIAVRDRVRSLERRIDEGTHCGRLAVSIALVSVPNKPLTAEHQSDSGAGLGGERGALPGTAIVVAESGDLRRARGLVTSARAAGIGVFDPADPLRFEAFEVRLLGRGEVHARAVIDLSKNDNVIVRPQSYFKIPHPRTACSSLESSSRCSPPRAGG